MVHNPKIYFAHWIDSSRMFFDKPVSIYNVHADKPEDPNVFNVLNISNEPEPTRMSNEKIIKIHEYFDLILTWDEEILSSCPNAKMFLCGMTWINKDDYIYNLQEKQFKISTFCTSKNLTENHRKRWELWFRQEEINIPHVFFNSSHNKMPIINNNPYLGELPHQKFEMFKDFQYSIVIENSNYKNYFTEKLMDCFITKTIPIYVGCPNIEDFFDIRGIFICNTVNDVISICNELHPGLYCDGGMQNVVNSNFINCLEYCRDFTDRLYEEISKYV